MVRLSNIKPSVAALGPVVRPAVDAHGHGETAARDWYRSREWEALRRRVFVRDGYVCQREGCGVLCVPGHVDQARWPVGDHRIPHRGRRELFFDEGNVQTLCKACHEGGKQAAAAAARREGG